MLPVSVIIPTYNRADYLPQALQSVLDQTRRPLEIIVVDDGSSDETAEIAGSFGSMTRYCRQEHQGVSAARNHGLAMAQGEIVAWLDADDVWEKDFLATITALLESPGGPEGVYTGLIRIDSEGNVLPQSSQTVVPPSELYSRLVEDCFIQTSAFSVRKRCFDQVGAFDVEFDICEDYDMFLRLSQAFTIVGVPAPLIRYRIHGQNTVANTTAFCQHRLALMRKHFGPSEGNPQSWPAIKRRAHGHAFRAVALRCIESGRTDEGWNYFQKGVSIWPSLLDRLDTFYELSCGDQPVGYRGQAEALDIEGNGAEVLRRLGHLFATAGPALDPMRRPAYGHAYLALGILSDQAGNWGAARRYLLRAIGANSRLLRSYPVMRRFLKLWTDRRIVGLWRTVSGRGRLVEPAGRRDE